MSDAQEIVAAQEAQVVCEALKKAYNDLASEVSQAGGELGVRWFVVAFLVAHLEYARGCLGRPEEGELVVHTFIQALIRGVQSFVQDS